MQRACLSILALLLLLSHLAYGRVESLDGGEVTRSSENPRVSEPEDDGDSSPEEESTGFLNSTAPGSEIAEDTPIELETELSPSPKPPKSSPSPRVEAKPSLVPSMEMPKASPAPPSSSPIPRRRRRHPKDPLDDEPSVARRYVYETHDSEKQVSNVEVNTYSEEGSPTEGGSEQSTSSQSTNSQSTSSTKGSSVGLVFGVLFAVGTVVVVGGFIGYKAWQRIQLSRYRGWRPYDVEMIDLQSHW